MKKTLLILSFIVVAFVAIAQSNYSKFSNEVHNGGFKRKALVFFKVEEIIKNELQDSKTFIEIEKITIDVSAVRVNIIDRNGVDRKFEFLIIHNNSDVFDIDDDGSRFFIRYNEVLTDFNKPSYEAFIEINQNIMRISTKYIFLQFYFQP